MTTFYTFEEIDVWKESRVFIQSIRLICKRPTVKQDFSFIDQITRSCRSIAANIAEGNDAQTSLEFIKFLSYAKRSAAEVRSHLYHALDESYISQEEFTQLTEQARKIARMLSRLMQYLRTIKTKPSTL